MEETPKNRKSRTLPHTLSSASSIYLDNHQQRQSNNSSRPVSLYDNNYVDNNNSGNNNSISRSDRAHGNIEESSSPVQDHCQLLLDDDNGSPSQAHCLVTTVPQNIVAQNIADKHTPTRNSLRHSRMIAMNQSGRVPRKYLPAIIRYHKLAKSLLGLLTLLGSALCFLALWLLLWAPNIRQRDNPHWSGISVLVSGIVGLMLLCCCRKEYPGMKRNYCVYSFKILSITMSTVAAVLSLVACAFAIIHLISIYTLTCEPPDQLNTTCICYIVQSSDDNDNKNNSSGSSMLLFPIKSYHYVDLSCVEVDNILSMLVVFSIATNLLAGILEVWYVYLHWASRYVYVYSKVRTNEQNPMVFLNSTS